MSDQSSSSEEEQPESKSKIRISFILSPSIFKERETLEIPKEPIAVPSSIRKRGLSAIVNHLLDRKVISDDDTNNNSDDSDDNEDQLPAIPFDFLLNSKLLRLSLDTAIRKEGLSTEHAIELEYFPARLPPRKDGESDVLPDWINVMDYNHSSGSEGNSSEGGIKGVLFTGGADGSIRSFQSTTTSGSSSLQQMCSVMAHTAPIKCLSTTSFLNGSNNQSTLVATGSMDQTLITHLYNPSSSSTLNLHAVYTGGHTNSIGSVALNNNSGGTEGGSDKIIMASGDWDGGLAIWSIPTSEEIADTNNNDEENSSLKKQKGIKGSKVTSSNNTSIHEVKPLQSIKAHSTNISGISFTHNNSSTIITGSWDHSLKIYDINRMDNILTLNGSRVITSISRCCNSNVVATSNSDNTVRLWDMRTDGSGSSTMSNGGMDKSLRTSHKGWISNVCWSNVDPYILGSTSHDGTLKVWDIRSSLPLHTVKAVSKKGEKVLCLSFGENVIYSGGSDCVVKQFGL